MTDVRQMLRMTADQPPPTGIDLDSLIERETRARTRRHVLAAGLASTLVLLTVGTVVMLSTQGLRPTGDRIGVGGPTAAASQCAAVRPTPSLSDQPSYDDVPRGGSSTPEEAESAAVIRLSAALNAAFEDHLPGRTVTDVTHLGCRWVQFEPRVYPALYYAWADVTDAAGTGGIVVMVNDKLYPGMGYDHLETLADGTQVGWHKNSVAPGSPGFQLGVLRPDGTHITVLCFNTKGLDHVVARPAAPASIDELVAIATDPGLTLYP
jgi:hypothetical protein